MMKQLVLTTILASTVTLSSCDYAAEVEDNFKEASRNVKTFAIENPHIDMLTGNTISNIALLLYGLGVTAGLFKVKRDSVIRGEALDELITSPNNNATIDSISDPKLRRATKNALK